MSHGEAFEYIESTIRSSEKIESLIGRVETVRLDPINSFREEVTGSEGWADLAVTTIGSRGETTIYFKLTKTDNKWTIKQANINGSLLLLE